MQSLVLSKPGLLEYKTGNAPRLLKGQAIIKIRRIGICGTDMHSFRGTQPYFNYPRILGHEIAADLVDFDASPGFTPGDRLTILPYFNCGHCIACKMGRTNCCVSLQVAGVHIDGGMVDYLSVPVAALVAGHGLSLDELALIEPLSIGFHAVKRAALNPGEFVLVIGAGPIGLAIMESAAIAGAKIIVLDVNEQRLSFSMNHMKLQDTILAGGSDTVERLKSITGGDMPTTVFDATGNLHAINQAFNYLSHAGKYVLVGLQREYISFSHPEFHKREATLMSSRNATRADFEQVIELVRQKTIAPLKFITHRAKFTEVKEEFEGWLDPVNGVIKAMVEWPE
jgi:2-desacetyl-2-hydroxyethyl bacteriochlorophyllide A dehydrogenase